MTRHASSTFLALASALCAAALAPAAAPAATLGSRLADAGTPQHCFGSAGEGDTCTIVQTDLAGHTLLAPAGGVVTRWSVRDAAGTLTLKVLRGDSAGRWVVAGSEPAAVGPDGRASVATRLPIAAGDAIGLEVPGSARVGLAWREGARLARYGALSDAPEPPLYEGPDDYELLLSALVEPDADGDGHGDESQDACPSDPARQTACADADAGDGPGAAPDAGALGTPGGGDDAEHLPGLPAEPSNGLGDERPHFAIEPSLGEHLDRVGAPATGTSVRLLSRTLRSARARVRVSLACEGPADIRCAGRLTLRSLDGRRLGTARLRIAAGAVRIVTVRLVRRTRPGMRVTAGLAAAGRHRVLGTLRVLRGQA